MQETVCGPKLPQKIRPNWAAVEQETSQAAEMSEFALEDDVDAGVSILRYFSRTLLIIYSHFYKKLGPFYKKLNCETMVTDHRPVRTIMHPTTTYKA